METQSRRIEQKCNKQFYDLLDSDTRFKVHQGGTRSGKTYAICQYITYLLTTSEKPLVISIIRKTLPALKGSVLRDIITILEQTGIYYLGIHNKAANTFEYGKHLIEFLSVDEPQKIRGRKRNIAFLNEGNELTIEDFRQINMRTTDMLILDFNPSDPIHWIYDDLIPRKDCSTWITTYKDNKFLSQELIFEIERMKLKDPDYWRVYGEGQKAIFSARQIFNNWNFIPYVEFPEFDLNVDAIIGIDFGFSNDQTAIVLGFKKNDNLYFHELLYKKGMTNDEIAEFLKVSGYEQVICYADSAEPKSIEEIKRKGLYVNPARKGQGSVNAGISLLKEYNIFVSKESKNIEKEYHSYYWTELKDGTIVNKPVDRLNHCMDAMRYATFSSFGRAENFFVI
tara:strand:- start:68 stop:1255 length:1188 start_codon:yes stop_codon:yes gene_type:complete